MGTAETAIGCVDVFQVDSPVAVPTGPAGVTYDRRSAVLVRVADGAGRVGWGETYCRAGTVAVLDELAEAVLGRFPREHLGLVDELSVLSPERLAVSALSIALDDLRARQFGVSVAALYGGPRRTSVGAYASSGGYREDLPPEQSWPAELDVARAEGFRAAKFRIGRHAPARELPILRALRDAAGPEFDLMVDANGAYAVPTALRVGRALADWQFRWFEEPLMRFRNGLAYPGYELLARLDLPVAAGEGLVTRTDFDAFLERGAAQIIQPDVAMCGGIGEGLYISDLAALRGRQCIPHAWGGAILIAATLQLLAIVREPAEVIGPDAPLLEIDRLENPLRTRLCAAEFRPVDGVVQIPDGPGLGIEIDEDFITTAASIHRHHTASES